MKQDSGRFQMIDLDAMDASTDSESGDAIYNPDIWELRARITALVTELRAVYAPQHGR